MQKVRFVNGIEVPAFPPVPSNCSTFPTLPLPTIHTFTRAQAHAGLIELVKRFDDGRLIIRNRRGELLTHLGQVIAAVMADDYEIGGGR